MSSLVVGGVAIKVAVSSPRWTRMDAVDRARAFDNTFRASQTGGAVRVWDFETPAVHAATEGETYKAALSTVASQLCSGDIIAIPLMCSAELTDGVPTSVAGDPYVVLSFSLHEVQPAKVLLRYSPGDTITGESFTRSTTATYVNSAGLVTTAAINAKRDAHYINGVRSLLLEGARENRIIWANDLTNAAWTKRGTCGVVFTATGPDGIASSATTITGLGALGVNDVFQAPTGFGATTRYEPGFWIRKVTATGTMAVQNPSAVAGAWTVNLALLGTGWEWITRWHTSVTISSEFVSSAGGAGGIHFGCSAGAPISVAVWGCQCEVGSFSSSTIPTTTVTVTRGTDNYSIPFTTLPQEMSVYEKFVELGSARQPGTVFYIGSAAGAVPAFLAEGSGTFYRSFHYNGVSALGSTLSVAPLLGDVVELDARLYGDGSHNITQSLNGGATTTSTQTAPLVLPLAWAGLLVWLNATGTSGGYGFVEIQSFKIVAGSRSLQEMRSL